MANVSSSNGLEKYPKLRFKGFTEPWEHVKLSDFVSRVTRKNSDNQTDIPLTISSKDGLINQNEFFSKQVASKDMSGYYLLQKGEFAYNKSYSVGFDFGSIKRLEKYDQGALSTLYICFALDRFDSDFIKHYFDSLKWYREIYMISAEGARNHGLLNVPTEDFFATLHTLPMNTAEQRRIAEFLDLLTAKIEKHQALVDNLKKYKRGVSEQLFEQIKSKSTQHVFSSIFVLLQNNTFSRELLTNEETEMQNIHYGDVLIKYGSCVDIDKEDVPYIKSDAPVDKFAPESYLMSGDIVIADTAEDYTVGKATEIINPNNKKILSGLHTIPCRPVMSFAPMFMGYYLNSSSFRSQIMPLIQGTKVSSIGKTQLMKTTVYIPPIDEQKRIADFLYSIDTKINLLSETADKMIQLKSAMLQQLFI